jgi:putative phosphoesterase
VEIAIIADTHLPRGTRRLPDSCVERLRRADLIVHAGDFIRLEVLDELERLGDLVAVHGNVDEPALRRRLPERASFSAGGFTIAVVHDSGPRRGRIERLRRSFPGADAVIFGHSHLPLHERDGEFQIFNPGSPTERRGAPHHTMGTARVTERGLEFQLVTLT